MSITTPLSGVTLNQYFRGPAPEYRPVRIGAGDIPLAGITASIHRFFAESLQSEPGKIYVDDMTLLDTMRSSTVLRRLRQYCFLASVRQRNVAMHAATYSRELFASVSFRDMVMYISYFLRS